jgi:Ca-activated chloride channel homolog
LARPQAVIQVPKEQATVIMVIDVSGSMNATDVFPTRMDSARSAAASFVDMVPEQFRIGVVTFSNTAQTLSPPTTDRDVVRAGLNSMQARGGTAMGDAIELALRLTELDAEPGMPPQQGEPQQEADSDAEPPPRVVLLLSDGYNTAGRSPVDVAAEAQREDVTIFTVALGTQEGTVELPGPGGVPRIIPVPPDEATLERIATMTNGSFFTAPSDNDLQEVYAELGSQIGYDSEHQEITVVFSAAGAVLMMLGALLSMLWFRTFP